MKSKVIANRPDGKAPIINSVPVKVGDAVEVDECTFRNLAKKGILEAADAESKKVDLADGSVLSEEDARAQANELAAARAAKKKADDEAKKNQ